MKAIGEYLLDEPLVLTPYPNGGYTITQPNRREPGFRDTQLGAYSSLNDALDVLRQEPVTSAQGETTVTVHGASLGDTAPVAETTTDYLGLLTLVWKFHDDLCALAEKHKKTNEHAAAGRHMLIADELREQLIGRGFAHPCNGVIVA